MVKETGVYIHIPFCLRKCSYCSFNSYPCSGDTGLLDGYASALLLEIEANKAETGVVPSVYFGGGTPTAMKPETLIAVLDAVKKKYKIQNNAEITVEANPGTAGYKELKSLKEGGFNRLSLGMQSVSDEQLKFLGRLHNFKEFLDCFKAARRAGFRNINIDLIYALPGQTIKELQKTIEIVKELAPEHISAYCLSIEDGTLLYERHKKGDFAEVEDGEASDMYYFLKKGFSSVYKHYELSNFALKGRESVHNQLYWNNKDYLGFGAGACAKYGGKRLQNEIKPAEYIKLIKHSGFAILYEDFLTEEIILKESCFLGLRLLKGINLAGWKEQFGKDFLFMYKEQVAKLTGLGLLEVTGGFVRLTDKGLFLSNEVFVEFV
ncbi:MAG: radical SAM family heme chaperone HemW [Candidatus Firestonebacteria bacterium]